MKASHPSLRTMRATRPLLCASPQPFSLALAPSLALVAFLRSDGAHVRGHGRELERGRRDGDCGAATNTRGELQIIWRSRPLPRLQVTTRCTCNSCRQQQASVFLIKPYPSEAGASQRRHQCGCGMQNLLHHRQCMLMSF